MIKRSRKLAAGVALNPPISLFHMLCVMHKEPETSERKLILRYWARANDLESEIDFDSEKDLSWAWLILKHSGFDATQAAARLLRARDER